MGLSTFVPEIKSISKAVMNNLRIPDLQGSLDVYLDQYHIQVECKGQLLQLTFPSLAALRHFIGFNRKIRVAKVLPRVIEKSLQHVSAHYYLGDLLIGKTDYAAAPNWLGSYYGLKNVKIFPKQILKYLFARKKA